MEVPTFHKASNNIRHTAQSEIKPNIEHVQQFVLTQGFVLSLVFLLLNRFHFSHKR